MAASDPIKTLRRILQAEGRPHMGTGLRRCDRIIDLSIGPPSESSEWV
jgi:hypothetical protein